MRKVLVTVLLLSAVAVGQQKRFDWVPGQSRSFRMEPRRWQALVNYGTEPLHLRMDVQATHAVSLALVRLDDWNYYLEHGDSQGQMPLACPAEGVLQSTYTCELAVHDSAMVLIGRDERRPHEAISEAWRYGAREAAAGLAAPTELTLTSMQWGCVENCFLPEYAWVRAFKEKFQITPIAKTYGPLTPERDGQQMRVKIKSPVPMLVAVLPVEAADQLRANPGSADAMLAGIECKQRGVQKTDFTCSMNVKQGTQQVVVMPEPGIEVPNKKKAEVQVDAVRCVQNCQNEKH
jgi:hypothetical protein